MCGFLVNKYGGAYISRGIYTRSVDITVRLRGTAKHPHIQTSKPTPNRGRSLVTLVCVKKIGGFLRQE